MSLARIVDVMTPSKRMVTTWPGHAVLVDCPFLYHTKTILQCRKNNHQTRQISASAIRLTPRARTTWTRQEGKAGAQKDLGHDVAESTSFLKQKAAEVASSKPKLGTSITASEQAAFDSMWAMFQSPSPPSTSKARATSRNHTDTDYKNILELFSSSPHPASETNSDARDVEIAVAPSTEDSNNPEALKSSYVPFNLSASKLNREGAIAETRGFLQDNPTASSRTHVSTERVQTTTIEIVKDVADSLTAALASTDPRPDIAMWKVAEEKIFPLIRLLRPSTQSLSSSPPPSSSSNSPNSTGAGTESDTAKTSLQPHPLVPSDVPLLPLLSQTYPSLTLLILRLYASHHPASPYVLSLLPTLRSLGPTSYVLGAHTHFYNTLLSIYWRMYSNLRGMNGLLAEMEANGVGFDVGTWQALGMIEDDRQKDIEGTGERGRMWWEKSEQRVWRQRVGVEWRGVVRRRLEEKGLMPTEVWREESDRVHVSVEGDKPDYVVTL